MTTDNIFSTDYNAACGLLEHLNIEELKDVLNDDSKFEDMIKDLKQSKEIEIEKEMLLASNRSLAEFNLNREPEVRFIKQELEELSRAGEMLYKSVNYKSNKLKSQLKNNTLDTTLALLQTAAAEMEEESETVAEGFLDGTTDVEGFLEPFTIRRKLMHLRRVKADKMSEMIARRCSYTFEAGLQSLNTDVYPSFYHPPPPPIYPLAPVTSMPLPTSYSLHGQF